MIYTRWGKSSCPSTGGTQLVYAGRAVGSGFNSPGGGGGEILCLPLNPDYIDNPRATSTSILHGGEYDTVGGPHNDLEDHNVPCAVCLASTRAAITMVPAKTQCPTSWTREYYGYTLWQNKKMALSLPSLHTLALISLLTQLMGRLGTLVVLTSLTSLPHAMMVFHVHNMKPTEHCPALSAPSS